MRRQDHGRDDYRDYINNLADQYLVWPTITLGVHIYIHETWHRVRGFSAWFMEYIWTRTERKEERLRREIFYVTWPAKLHKELSWHVFVHIHVVKICAGISIDQDMHEATGVSAWKFGCSTIKLKRACLTASNQLESETNTISGIYVGQYIRTLHACGD